MKETMLLGNRAPTMRFGSGRERILYRDLGGIPLAVTESG